MGERDLQLLVGIDEYDAPANSVFFSPHQDRYHRVAEYFKAEFYAVIRHAIAKSVILKTWITGVLPVFRDGISPLTSMRILSSDPRYHGLCGLTNSEVKTVVKAYLGHDAVGDAMETLRSWYNGHLFAYPVSNQGDPLLEPLYNPQLVFTHLQGLAEPKPRRNLEPRDEIEANHIGRVLQAIPNDGKNSFIDLFVRVNSGKLEANIRHEFGPEEVRQIGLNVPITVSFRP